MTSDDTLTLRLVLLPTKAFATALATTLSALAAAGSLGQEILDLPDAAKTEVGNKVGDAVASLAGTRVRDILTDGWCLERKIYRAAEETAGDPSAQRTVNLNKHRVTWAHRPEVDVYLDGVLLRKIHVAIVAAVTVATLEAVVRGGRLVSVDVGDVEASVSPSVEGHDLPGRTARVDLPGGIPLGDGIVIVEAPGGGVRRQGE
jgi:hypothetical protein